MSVSRRFVRAGVVLAAVAAIVAALPVGVRQTRAPAIVVDGQRIVNAADVLASATGDFVGAHDVGMPPAGVVWCGFASEPHQPRNGVIACHDNGFPSTPGWDVYRIQPPVDGRVGKLGVQQRGASLPSGTTLSDGEKAVATIGSTQAVDFHGPSNPYPAVGLLLFLGGVAGLVWALRTARSDGKAKAQEDVVERSRLAWERTVADAWAPPVVPPTPTLREPPARPARTSVAAVDPVEVVVPPPTAGPPSAGQSTQPPDSAHATSPDGRGESADEAVEPQPVAWSGPALLMLGPVEAVGWDRPPDRRVLVELAAFLACHQERPVSVSEIRLALWPEGSRRGEEVKPETVGQHLSRLRRCLGAEHLPEGRGGYQLASTVSSDWFRFQALEEAARHAEPARAAEIRRDALALVRGRPFAGVPDGSYLWVWDEMLVSTIEGAIATTAHRAAEHHLQAGQPRLAEWAARRGLLAVPTDEQLLADRLAAAAGTGGKAGLSRAWRDTVAVLGDQADHGPLADIHRRLVGQFDSTSVVGSSPDLRQGATP